MKESSQLKTEIRIGKKGLTETVIKEISARTKKKSLIKVKFLKSFFYNPDISKKETIKEALKIISEKANVKVLETLGSTSVLSKK